MGAYGPLCFVAVVTFGFAMVVTSAVVCVSTREKEKLRLTVQKQKVALAAAASAVNDVAANSVKLSSGGGAFGEERELDKPVERSPLYRSQMLDDEGGRTVPFF